MAPKEGFYDYRNKYQAGTTVETCPAEIPEEKSPESPRGIDRHSSLPIRIQPWAILRISSQSCPKSIPTAAASWRRAECGWEESSAGLCRGEILRTVQG